MDTRTATAELGWTANPASGVSVRPSTLQSCCVVLGPRMAGGSRACMKQHLGRWNIGVNGCVHCPSTERQGSSRGLRPELLSGVVMQTIS